MSLTYHNIPTWYQAKRVGGDEILTVLAWSGRDVYNMIGKIEPGAVTNKGSEIQSRETIFPNGRQVCVIKLLGGAK